MASNISQELWEIAVNTAGQALAAQVRGRETRYLSRGLFRKGPRSKSLSFTLTYKKTTPYPEKMFSQVFGFDPKGSFKIPPLSEEEQQISPYASEGLGAVVKELPFAVATKIATKIFYIPYDNVLRMY
ncbi:hypothetical protein HK096_006298 [Nowakowskiella sp. JEL0078]|nr:hypothetical protein HK096_006298 [Nowakowskiella sp. JEL0078]